VVCCVDNKNKFKKIKNNNFNILLNKNILRSILAWKIRLENADVFLFSTKSPPHALTDI
jgi:hypothetical protein